MPIDFPSNPSINNIITRGSKRYIWTGEQWAAYNTGSVAIPVGAVMAFAQPTPPTGWLACNGQSVPRSGAGGYPNLFAAIGTTYGSDNSTTFKLPDLRGYFVRGSGTNGDGTASGAFGAKQLDDFKSHTHLTYGRSSDDDDEGGGSNPSAKSFLTESSATGGTETRPKNIAMLYCIKF
jgi:microcystin-dependent protein